MIILPYLQYTELRGTVLSYVWTVEFFLKLYIVNTPAREHIFCVYNILFYGSRVR